MNMKGHAMPQFVTDEVEEFEPKERVYAKGPRGPRARSEEQQEWDAAFMDAHQERGFIAVQVKPADAEEAKKRVMSAARFNGLAVSEGEPKPGRVEGTVILSWKIREPKKRAAKPETAETPE